jgi:hypothetical protein
MKKDYIIKQRVKIGGDVQTVTIYYTCEESELQSIVAMLAGVVTVFAEDVALSSPEGANDVITNSTDIENIIMKHSGDKTVFFGAFGKPIRFDASKSGKEIAALFKTHKPFPNRTTEHPDNVQWQGVTADVPETGGTV